MASSSNGVILAAVDLTFQSGNPIGRIYISTNSGVSFTARGPTLPWTCVSISSDGTRVVAGGDNTQLYFSSDSFNPKI